MTDVGNMQAVAVGTAPVAARPMIAVVPLKGLPIVAAGVAFVKDHVRGAALAVVLVMLVIYALDVPLIIVFTVARYSSPRWSCRISA